MNQKDYDDFYESAVWCLEKLRGHKVGEAKQASDGIRYRHVDGLAATDEKVFELAWGKEVANHVVAVWKPR
jgi:hypothetical protein